MDELLATVLKTYYSPEALEEVYRSFGLFGLFNYSEAVESFDEVINETDQFDSNYVQDHITSKLHEHLDFLLDHHGLALVQEASLQDKNELLTALYSLQYLENYEPIVRVLESTQEPEVQICRILEQVCSYDQSRIHSLIDQYRDVGLRYLREYINTKEIALESAEQTNDVIKQNLLLLHTIAPFEDFEQAVLGSGLILGVPFASYLPLFEDEIVDQNDIAASVKRLMFMVMISSDGAATPLKVFNDNIAAICKNPTLVSMISVQFNTLLGKFNETKAAYKQL